tara:strand:+ start:1157 stop:1855 length:699 start_codon:yes stop_codon:yes gene_type:complete
MKQSDQGILIHRQNYSESSLLITLFTKNNGIQKFISKGVKKKSGNLNPLGIYEIIFYKSPKQDLGNITEINQVQVYYNKNTSPLKNIISFFLADLLKQTLKTETEDQESYSYIYNQIQKLHAVDDFNKFLILFMINFLDILGIQPLIENDNANCFDIQKGTFIYENKETSTQIINPSVQIIIQLIKKTNPNSSELIKHSKETLILLIKYCSIHIPNFNMDESIKIIREILYD